MFSKQKYLFIFPLVLAALYGCGFMPLKNSNIKTNFVITQDLPNSLKVKLLAIQNYEKSGALEVRINDYDFKKYEVYHHQAKSVVADPSILLERNRHLISRSQ